MFVARVEGKSMEPRIPDGSYCLFDGPVAGTRPRPNRPREAAQCSRPGHRTTVHRQALSKRKDRKRRRLAPHLGIVLEPLNPDYESIELTGEDESPVAVIAELIDVIGTDSPLE